MSPHYQNVLITGANRGIGLEFVRQLLAASSPPKNLIATTRSESDALKQLSGSHSNLHILKYDVTDFESYPTFADQVGSIVTDEGLDLLINNAGIYLRDSLDRVEPKTVLANIETNSVGPLMLTKTLLPLLKVN